jgi:hypothetical protein
MFAERRSSLPTLMILADVEPMHLDAAPVIAGEVLLKHGFSDELICAHLARQWPLDETERQAALRAAHMLVRRENLNR